MTSCGVKRSRRGEDLEVLVTKTEVEKLEKVFDVESVSADTKKMGKLKELNVSVRFLLLVFQQDVCLLT